MKQRTTRGVAVAAVAGLVSLSAAACSIGGSTSPSESTSRTLKVEYGSFADIDPANLTYGMYVDQSALLEGLVVENDTLSDVKPGAADKWEQSPDGLTYTFHIRKGANWSDGHAVTSQDFVYSLQRAVAPRSGADAAPASFQPSIGIKGVDDYAAGSTKDFSTVGIKAVDPTTVEYTLAAPNPDFLLQMADAPMLPLPEHALKAHPKDWQTPDVWVGNGPYTLSAWAQNSSMTLKKNAKYWDADKVSIDTVQLKLVAPGSESTLAYDNNEVNLTPVPQSDIKRYQSGEQNKQLLPVPAGQMMYMGMIPSRNPVLKDVRIRQAISMGIDRAAMAKTIPGGEPAPLLVPSTTPGWKAEDGVKDDISAARELLAQAGFPGGKGLPVIHILTPSGDTTPASAVADSLKTNLGIDAQPDAVEIGVYVAKRKTLQPADYVGFYFGTFAGLPTWRFWTTRWIDKTDISRLGLSATDYAAWDKARIAGSPTAESLLKNTDTLAQGFNDALATAGKATSSEEAKSLYQKAALAREKTYYYLPLLYVTNYWLAKPEVKNAKARLGFQFAFDLKTMSMS